jgi:hypothetical protein
MVQQTDARLKRYATKSLVIQAGRFHIPILGRLDLAHNGHSALQIKSRASGAGPLGAAVPRQRPLLGLRGPLNV